MAEFHLFIARVLQVLPKDAGWSPRGIGPWNSAPSPPIDQIPPAAEPAELAGEQDIGHQGRHGDAQSPDPDKVQSIRPTGRAGRALFSGGSIGVRDPLPQLSAFPRGGNAPPQEP